MGSWLSRYALPLIVCLGGVLRFATIGGQGFWLDENVTLDLVREAPGDLLRGVEEGESNPPLFYLVAAGWERVFGSSEFGVRSLSALLGTATIPAVYAAASSLASRRAGLVAAALTATSPLLIWYSQETRNYALLAFLAALAFWFFARALQKRGSRWLWAWVVASALALATHYFAIFLIVPLAAWLFIKRSESRAETAIGIGVVAAVGLALLPLAATQRGRGDWIDDYSLSDRLFRVPEHLLVGLQVPWEPMASLAVAAVGLIALYGVIHADGTARRAIAIAGSVVLGGIALLSIAVIAGDDYIITRNLLELWAPFAVAIAVALMAASVGWLGPATAVALCAAGTALVLWIALTPGAQRPDYSELAAELDQASEQRLIVSQSGFSLPITLYLDGSRVAMDGDLSTSELVVIQQRPTDRYALGICWWTATCGGIDEEPPPPFEAPPGFELDRNGSTEQFEYSVYTAPTPIQIERPVEFLTPRVFVQTPG
jgi:mannosyltransferase